MIPNPEGIKEKTDKFHYKTPKFVHGKNHTHTKKDTLANIFGTMITDKK